MDVCAVAYECISVLCSMPITIIGNALTIVSFYIYQSICCFFAPLEAGTYPGITRTRNFCCEFCKTLPVLETCVSYVRHYPYPNFLFSFGLKGTHKTVPGVFIPGITLQRTSVTSVRHSYPYPELLELVYAGATKTRGAGTACLYLPGTSGSSVRPCHNTRKFWKFFYPRTWNFCDFCKTRATLPGVRVHSVLYLPGTSVSSVCLCHNTRNFWKFCNTYPKLLEVL